MGLASTLGKFIGAVLAECAPILVEIIIAAIRGSYESVEESSRRPDLRKRLLERLHKNHPDSSGGTRKTTGTPEED